MLQRNDEEMNTIMECSSIQHNEAKSPDNSLDILDWCRQKLVVRMWLCKQIYYMQMLTRQQSMV